MNNSLIPIAVVLVEEYLSGHGADESHEITLSSSDISEHYAGRLRGREVVVEIRFIAPTSRSVESRNEDDQPDVTLRF